MNQPGGAAISRGERAVEDLVFDILSGGTFHDSRCQWVPSTLDRA